MEKFTVTCPSCLADYQVNDTHVGKSAHCNKCDTKFVIAKPGEAATVDHSSALRKPSRKSSPRQTVKTKTAPQSRSPSGAGAKDITSSVWNPGDVILGVYEIKSLKDDAKEGDKHYAEGGMGRVYRVYHRGWDLDLAVKSPKAEAVRTRRGKENFERECETWIDLGLHPNIVSCYYVRYLDDIPLVFAEFVAGGTLQDWVRDRRLYDGGLDQTLSRILDIAIQFAWGLDYAHQRGLVHQDVKPGNVMMRASIPKVTDFGLAKACGVTDEPVATKAPKSNLVTWAGMTPGYCSPEQVEAAAQMESGIPVTQRTRLTRHTDIWSWAISVLEMFCGKPPCRYGGQTAAKVLHAYLKHTLEDEDLPPMPQALAQVLGHCFRKKPAERPKDAVEVAEALCEIYEQVTGSSYPRQPPVTAELKVDGLNNRAASLLDLGKSDEAGRLLDEAWEQYPWQPQLTHNRALLAWRAGRMTDVELISQQEKLCKTRPQDWEAAYSLGLVCLECGEIQTAIKALQQSISLGAGDEVRATLERANTLLPRTPRCVRAFTGRSDRLTAVYLSDDGKRALSGIDDHTLRVWEVATGQSILGLDAPGPEPGSSVLSDDGQWELVVGCNDTFELGSAASGPRGVSIFHPLAWGPSSGVATPNGRAILSANDEHALELRKTKTGNLVRTFIGHAGTIHSIAVSADGRWALSGSSDKTVRLWEVATGRCLRTFKGHTSGVHCVFLAPDASWALSASKGKTLRIWDTKELCRKDRRFVAPVLLCHVTSSEEASKAQARFADLCTTSRQLAAKGHYREALRLARAARGLTGYDVTSESLDLWNQLGSHCIKTNLRDAWCARTFQGHEGEVRAGVLDDDAKQVLSAGSDRSLRLWDAATGRLTRVFQGHTDSVRSAAVSANGLWALSGSWDKTLRLWDTATGECCQVFEGHANYVNAVGLSRDGRWALSGSWDRSLRLWQVNTGHCVRSFAEHTAYVNSIFLSADGRWAVSGGEDKTVRLWDMTSSRSVRTFQGHADWVCAVTLSPDARSVLSGGKDGTLMLWDVASGHCVGNLDGHAALVASVAISADGQWALSGSKDKTMRLWNLVSGECQHVFEGHTGLVASVGLSGDARWALSGSEDGLLHLWELDWEYRFPGWSDWDEKARPCLETFLTSHTPYVQGDIARDGKPKWSDQHFQQLLRDLKHQGFGWIEPEGVQNQLEKMATQWQGPPQPPGLKPHR